MFPSAFTNYLLQCTLPISSLKFSLARAASSGRGTWLTTLVRTVRVRIDMAVFSWLDLASYRRLRWCTMDRGRRGEISLWMRYAMGEPWRCIDSSILKNSVLARSQSIVWETRSLCKKETFSILMRQTPRVLREDKTYAHQNHIFATYSMDLCLPVRMD